MNEIKIEIDITPFIIIPRNENICKYFKSRAMNLLLHLTFFFICDTNQRNYE